jgi:hypothetical protein
MPPKFSNSARSSQLEMPRWATAWAVIGSIVCIWDATYVLTRPRSMAKGDLFHMYTPYAKYITLDPLYGNLKNAFVVAQSWMNLVEVALAFIAIFLYHVAGRRNGGCLLLLIASVMTWSKTVLYFVHDNFERPLHPQKSSIDIPTWEYVFLFIVPSLVWVVFPFACMWSIARQILGFVTGKVKST